MTHLYVTNSGAVLGVCGGMLTVKQDKVIVRSFPKESIESVTVFGNSTLTTPCMQYLLTSRIPVCFFSGKCHYYGRLEAVESDRMNVIRMQMEAADDSEYAYAVAKRIIAAKIRNQSVLLSRYIRENKSERLAMLRRIEYKVRSAENRKQLLGIEGMAAKLYFQGIGEAIVPEFIFHGRSRKPPKDPFNSLISLGYTLIMQEIYSALKTEGLSPYCGILHEERTGLPALACDLMEEWRPVIADSVALSMLQGGEMQYGDFFTDEETRGVYLKKEDVKKMGRKSGLQVKKVDLSAIIKADDRRLVLAIYDVPNNKRRQKLVKLLTSYGVRVQKSAFEAVVTDRQYNDIQKRATALLEEEDNFRMYRLNSSNELLYFGTTAELQKPESAVII